MADDTSGPSGAPPGAPRAGTTPPPRESRDLYDTRPLTAEEIAAALSASKLPEAPGGTAAAPGRPSNAVPVAAVEPGDPDAAAEAAALDPAVSRRIAGEYDTIVARRGRPQSRVVPLQPPAVDSIAAGAQPGVLALPEGAGVVAPSIEPGAPATTLGQLDVTAVTVERQSADRLLPIAWEMETEVRGALASLRDLPPSDASTIDEHTRALQSAEAALALVQDVIRAYAKMPDAGAHARSQAAAEELLRVALTDAVDDLERHLLAIRTAGITSAALDALEERILSAELASVLDQPPPAASHPVTVSALRAQGRLDLPTLEASVTALLSEDLAAMADGSYVGRVQSFHEFEREVQRQGELLDAWTMALPIGEADALYSEVEQAQGRPARLSPRAQLLQRAVALHDPDATANLLARYEATETLRRTALPPSGDGLVA